MLGLDFVLQQSKMLSLVTNCFQFDSVNRGTGMAVRMLKKGFQLQDLMC